MKASWRQMHINNTRKEKDKGHLPRKIIKLPDYSWNGVISTL